MSHAPVPPAPQAAADPPPGARAEGADPMGADAGSDPLPRWLVYLGVAVAFPLVGPPLGTVAVGLPVMAVAWLWGGAHLGDIGGGLLMLLGIALYSYLFGVLPALLTGLVAVRAWPHLRGWRAHLRIGLVGAGFSAACIGSAIALFGDHAEIGALAAAAGLCALAGFSGATLLSRALQTLRGG
ncbi:hypothetical protein [Xanthomonas sacchari]|uniref:hypothetical protein n=3 Tax=Xanthomonas TaxID=338 RepID=UPI00225AF679|nr:hypothetical protein [Xanthomonas sacchari]